jgi:WD40 repeat protein
MAQFLTATDTNAVSLRLRYQIASLAVSPESDLLAIGGVDGNVHIVQLTNLTEIRALKYHWCPAYGIDFSSDGQFLASGDRRGFVAVWDVRKIREALAGQTSGRTKSKAKAERPDARSSQGGPRKEGK